MIQAQTCIYISIHIQGSKTELLRCSLSLSIESFAALDREPVWTGCKNWTFSGCMVTSLSTQSYPILPDADLVRLPCSPLESLSLRSMSRLRKPLAGTTEFPPGCWLDFHLPILSLFGPFDYSPSATSFPILRGNLISMATPCHGHRYCLFIP